MFHSLNAEGYKLLKTKNIYICTAFIVVFIFLMYGILGIIDGIQNGNVENGTAGIIVTQNGKAMQQGTVLEKYSIAQMVQQIFSGDLIACVLAVFITVFTIGDYSSGMIKNTVGKGNARAGIFLSKLLMAELASIFISLAGIGAVFLGAPFYMGKAAFESVSWSSLAAYIGLQLMLIIPLAAIYVLIGELTRNLAAGISIGISIAVFPILLLNGLDIAFQEGPILPSSLWPISRSSLCPLEGFSAGYAAQTALVAAAWTIAATAAGLWHFYKTDIK